MFARSSVFLSFSLVFAPLARAQTNDTTLESSPPRRLEVSGTAPCAKTDAFAERLRTGNSDYSFVAGEPPSIQVRFDTSGGAIEATVMLREEDGTTLSRKLYARSCEEAELGAAFVITVALTRARQAKESRTAGLESRTPSKQGTSESQPQSNAPAAKSEGEALNPLRADRATPKPTSRSSASIHRSHFVGGLSGGMLVGPAPDPLFGIEGSFGAETKQSGLWAPALYVGVSYFRAYPHRTTLGAADFSSGLLSLTACPSQARLAAFGLRPCVLARAGGLLAEGFDTLEPRSALRPWVDVGLRLNSFLILTSSLRAHATFEAQVPFNQDAFRFGNQTFHVVPPVTCGASFGLFATFR